MADPLIDLLAQLGEPIMTVCAADRALWNQPIAYAWLRGDEVLYIGCSVPGVERPMAVAHEKLRDFQPGDRLAIRASRDSLVQESLTVVGRVAVAAMDRRVFLGALGLLVAPIVAQAQQPARLGVLLAGSPSGPTPAFDALLRRLAELGWVEGRSLIVERRWAEDAGRLSTVAAELVALNTTIIVAPGPGATAAAKAATQSIPIVMIGSADPVAAGFVASLARPGGNLTGVSTAPPEVVTGKRLELLKQALPALQKVAVLWDTTIGPLRQVSVDGIEVDGRHLGIRFQHLTVLAHTEFEKAFRTARAGGAGAVLLIETPLMTANAQRVAELGLKYRLPLMAIFPTIVTQGALMSYGPDIVGLFRRAAVYVDKILRGAAPADLPIERPTTLSLAINLKTAKALGLTIPPSLLARADQVIDP